MTLGENSTIRIGLLVVILTAVITAMGTLGGFIWWASALQTKVDSILSRLDTSNMIQIASAEKIADHETRLRLLEQKKTP